MMEEIKKLYEEVTEEITREVIKEDGKEIYWNNYKNNALWKVIKGNTEIEYKEDRIIKRAFIKQGKLTIVVKDGAVINVRLEKDNKEIFNIHPVEKDFNTEIALKVKYNNGEILSIETSELSVEFDGTTARIIEE